jgi:light-regulated signal transduction histidine kinase (bacteriophytochrome)
MRQRLEVRRPPPANPISQTPSSYLAASATDLLKLVDADFALLSIEEESRAIGRLDPYQEALAIMEYLQTCRFTEVRSSININADFPGIMYPPGIKTIAGLLVIPFNIGELNDYMVFFRKGQLREVKWAG